MFTRPANISRRGFFHRSVATLTAAGLPVWFAKEFSSAAMAQQAQATEKQDKNSKLQIGWVGIGSPISRALQIYKATRDFENIEHVAVCDVDARHLYRAATIFNEDNKLEPQQYSNYRDLIDRDDIDVVVVATPDHTHAEIAIAAMLKGKDVYCEKPLTLTIEEAQQIIAVQKKTGKVLQTGSQQRSEYNGVFRLAAEIVRSGKIGKIKSIECRIGKNPVSGPISEAKVPASLDWDQWLGPTAMVSYRMDKNSIGRDLANRTPTNCHYNFRWFQAYSGGKMTDWGAHHIDIAHWCLGMDGSGPVSLVCEESTGFYTAGDGYEWPEDFKVRMTYANGVNVYVMSENGSETKLVDAKGKDKKVTPNDNGVLVYGEGGTIFVSRGGIYASQKEILTEEPQLATPLYDKLATNHFGNFLNCIETRKDPICSALVGGGSVTVCHLGVIALQLGVGQELSWDPTAQKFTGGNAEVANAKIARPRRTGPIQLT